ncbi:MAG: YgiQ family radical SAM protein [Gemmataceae bacterium]|nr:YgiQ family radical SAM protein [Gemmataceae bacterium]
MKPNSRLSLPLWEKQYSAPLAPTTRTEMEKRGWDAVDVVFVTGDAYIDHPSFAMAILQRVLEAAGFRVAILSQPNWKSVEDFRQFGKPRLFFAVSAGNMDSLINHYTANKKIRNDDAYSPGGKIGLRPDRATLPYSQRCREAFPGVPVIAGGVEASLRRLAHFDYWSETVRRSILLDSKADLVVYGMGEKNIVQIAQRLAEGKTVRECRDLRSVAYRLGAKEASMISNPNQRKVREPLAGIVEFPFQVIPSFTEVKNDKLQFVEATRQIHLNTNPFNAHALVQFHENEAVVATPPDFPLTQEQMDTLYDLPFTRRPHPKYTEPIPAYEMIKDSVTIMRGCFGGCTFCSITAHQGRIIQSRSPESILREVKKMAADPEFKGVISDIGGATANMYQMRCTRPDVEAKCKRLSCVHPTICKLLGTDHGPLIELMRKVRQEPGIRKVFVASGIRMDLAQLSDEYVKELAEHHTGGRLKVAPEHTHPEVLKLMKKPAVDNFGVFAQQFKEASQEVGKPKQFVVPYFIASHPGSDLEEMIHLAIYLKRNGYRPDQVQDFIPAPFDIATCMWYTGIDPMTGKEVKVARNLRDRKLQRALMQFFKPENWFEVREALVKAGRTDLIGSGCDCLIPAQPPKEAIEAKRAKANQALRHDYTHSIANPAKGEPAGEHPVPPQVPQKGYRPKRTTQRRRNKR